MNHIVIGHNYKKHFSSRMVGWLVEQELTSHQTHYNTL